MSAAVARDFDNEGGEEQPVSSFQSLAAEGDILAKQGDFRKAIEAYSKALNQRPNDKNVLVARSRCYLALGENQSALEDAETSLKDDKDFFKGKFQKAEALYAKGDFEMALVYYHRGHLVRPELDEFRLGIQKAREAIDNSIGNKINPRDYKPKNGDSSHKSNTGSDALRSDKQRGISVAPLTLSGSQQASPFAASKSSPQNERTVKLLLGEMYEDKEFLEDLLHDRDFTNNPNEAVRQLVFEGLKYLEARTEFWRQQKPLYARKKDSVRPKTHKSDEHGKKAESEAEKEREMLVKEAQKKKYTFKTTEEAEQWVQVHWSAIHRAHEIGNYEKTLRLCKTFLYDLGGSSKVAAKSANESLQLIPNKESLFCDIYATIGKVYLQMKNNREAEHWTKKQLALARQKNLTDSQSLSLATLGRVYVQQGRYQEAVAAWEEKLPITIENFNKYKSEKETEKALTFAIETTWLYHDVSKCFLALYSAFDATKNAQYILKAELSASKASEWAQNAVNMVSVPDVPVSRLIAEDPAAAEAYRWSLYAHVLNAQVFEKKNNCAEAKDTYQKALKLATQLNDNAASQAIQNALQSFA